VSSASQIPRLTDVVEAIERIRSITDDTTLDDFEADWQRQWLVERGVEIISEASRHLLYALSVQPLLSLAPSEGA
jgi:uncharacterized protein with HEPN domain